MKVAPERIEEVLCPYPNVTDAAAALVTNATGSSDIWAAVVAPHDTDLKGLLAYAHDRLFDRAPTKIVRLDAIPRNAIGKIQRAAVKELLLKS